MGFWFYEPGKEIGAHIMRFLLLALLIRFDLVQRLPGESG
jgi:hypothetical protein